MTQQITIQQLLRSKGFNATDATVLVELAAHAADEAMETVFRICDTAPDDNQFTAYLIAMLFLNKKQEDASKKVGDVLKQAGIV